MNHGLLDELNDAQRSAVTHGSGPLLVLAGAGSGKTRVITRRIAYLILDRKVDPSRLVAVTFTNKAAAEMRDRVERLLGTRALGGWIGTFHSLCLRILRRDGERVGLAPGFTIYDTDDQKALIRRILKDEESDDGTGTPRSFLSKISRAKNALQSPDEFERQAFSPERKFQAVIFRRYDEALRKANAADFDDLLLRTIELFRSYPEIAGSYASRCEHLLVDEYQDTNRPQYLLVRALSTEHGNVCVVGDEDQCIYRFRGAELRNILEFESDHPGATTIRLEQNYRSTSTILQAAGAVIANNMYRKGKTLWTQNPDGERLELFRAPDDRTEAAWIAQRVRRFDTEMPFEDMAVLYRTNAQSRQIEEIFRRERIPYQIVGSVQFYERKEIKDLLGYLKLIANPADDVAFRRVVNTPTRGIGATTLLAVEQVGRRTGLPLMEASGLAIQQDLLPARSAGKLGKFIDFIADCTRHTDDQPVAELLERILAETEYEGYLDKLYGGLGSERMENAKGLVSAAAEYADEDDGANLEGFLDRSALVSDADDVGKRPGVTLMTIHCAKGLEFPVVFLAGLEENLFPHAMSGGSDEDFEEERRLCYVAMTRARKRLLLTHAQFRRIQGAFLPNPPSRFITEIPRELIRDVSPTKQGFFDDDPQISRAGTTAWRGSSAARAAAKPPRVKLRGQPAPSGEPAEDGFGVGALVLHPRFGGGKILDREGSGKHLKLTIHFSDHGPKKILPAYTKLRVED